MTITTSPQDTIEVIDRSTMSWYGTGNLAGSSVPWIVARTTVLTL